MAGGGERIRRRVLYRGHVQGVCFRMTAVDISHGHAVGGYVRNLPDGDVELEAEGETAAVEAFLAAVAKHFHAHIHQSQQSAVAPRGDELRFEIRY